MYETPKAGNVCLLPIEADYASAFWIRDLVCIFCFASIPRASYIPKSMFIFEEAATSASQSLHNKSSFFQPMSIIANLCPKSQYEGSKWSTPLVHALFSSFKEVDVLHKLFTNSQPN